MNESGSIIQYICHDFNNVARKIPSATTVNFGESRSRLLKSFLKILTVGQFIFIKALLKNRLNLIKSIKKHLNLNDIWDKKVSQISADDLMLIKISNLMLSSKKRWIIVMPSEEYNNFFLKTIIVTIVSKAECNGEIAIFSKFPIISEQIIESRANNFNYSSFYI